MSAETELYKLEFQYCGKIGMLQVQGANYLILG